MNEQNDIYMNLWDQENKKYVNTWLGLDQPCIAAEAMRKQNEGKPPWLWSKTIMISCNCPRCVPIF